MHLEIAAEDFLSIPEDSYFKTQVTSVDSIRPDWHLAYCSKFSAVMAGRDRGTVCEDED